jgi:hypothetical protein
MHEESAVGTWPFWHLYIVFIFSLVKKACPSSVKVSFSKHNGLTMRYQGNVL